MTRTETLYLNLLRQAVGLTEQPLPPLVLSTDEIVSLLQLAQRQATGPLIYDQLLALPKTASWLNETQKQQMKQVCVHNMLLQDQWLPLLRQTIDALRQGGIEPVLLKGFGLANLYNKPYLRLWGDLDIWVGAEQYHPACAILRQLFPQAEHHDEEWEQLKHYCFVFPDGKAIELHRVAMNWVSPKDQCYWQILESDGMRRGKMDEALQIALPEERFNRLFVFTHAWEHFTGMGMPMKQLCDLALLAQCPVPMDLSAYLEQHLKALRMLEPWQLVGYALVHLLGLEPSQWPLYKESRWLQRIGPLFIEDILHNGQFRPDKYVAHIHRFEAREEARQMPLIKRKWKTFRLRIDDYRWLRRYAPRYARHTLWANIQKGIRRTIRCEEMINY